MSVEKIDFCLLDNATDGNGDKSNRHAPSWPFI